jgi:hypothetical protein
MDSNSRRTFLAEMIGVGVAAPAAPGRPGSGQGEKWSDARAHGALGDGTTLDTSAIQSAIDARASEGGGVVFLPPGVFLSGTLTLRSKVTLHVSEGAVLRGSTRLADYPVNPPKVPTYTSNYTERSLILAENAERTSIEGRGVIDGQGAAFKGEYKVRPYLLRFVNCRGVLVRGVRLENSPMWVQHYLGCEDVELDGVTVRSRVNANNDGIDIDSCQRVRISGCDISSGDDALCLKSTMPRPCRDVVITNCVLSSQCNAIKLGTESNGGFENIVISNCAAYDTRLSGVAIEMVDGGTLRNVLVSNMTMRGVQGPIFVRLGNRARPIREKDPRPSMGSLSGVMLQGIRAVGAGKIGCSITGLPAYPVTDVTLRDVSIEYEGGGTAEDAGKEVPEHPDRYPEYTMFQTLPAYGFYLRHAADVRLENVRFGCSAEDRRPALCCDDVDGLSLDKVHARSQAGGVPPIRLVNVRNATILASRQTGGTGPLVKLEGQQTDQILLGDNAVAQKAKPFDAAPDVPQSAVRSRD